MTQDQERKMEVLKFTEQLRAAGVTNGNGQLQRRWRRRTCRTASVPRRSRQSN